MCLSELFSAFSLMLWPCFGFDLGLRMYVFLNITAAERLACVRKVADIGPEILLKFHRIMKCSVLLYITFQQPSPPLSNAFGCLLQSTRHLH